MITKFERVGNGIYEISWQNHEVRLVKVIHKTVTPKWKAYIDDVPIVGLFPSRAGAFHGAQELIQEKEMRRAAAQAWRI